MTKGHSPAGRPGHGHSLPRPQVTALKFSLKFISYHAMRYRFPRTTERASESTHRPRPVTCGGLCTLIAGADSGTLGCLVYGRGSESSHRGAELPGSPHDPAPPQNAPAVIPIPPKGQEGCPSPGRPRVWQEAGQVPASEGTQHWAA